MAEFCCSSLCKQYTCSVSESEQSPQQPNVMESFHPLVQKWFREKFSTPTEPQDHGWQSIVRGKDTLIAAPTGSGKTLAAFLACLDDLLRQSLTGDLEDGIQVLYLSPLKALSSDIYRSLQTPLEELFALAQAESPEAIPIRAATRTGDTTASARAKMVRTPPHILVTTPESAYILLTAEKSRKALQSLRYVIVDEIHAIASSKRGAQLTLSLERIDRLVTQAGNKKPLRIGLSATQKPIELIAHMLGGTTRPTATIVDKGHSRPLDLALCMTKDELGAVATHEQMGRMYDAIAALVQGHQETIVFVNTRRMVEKVSHQLAQRLGEESIVAHHGSMSKDMRFAAEQKLKQGTVPCVVATASLELGIDIGGVDLVIQVGSSRSIATSMQRIGRSGHSVGKTPKGRIFPTTRDQLLECIALLAAIDRKDLDAILPCGCPLDIAAQQIVATVAAEDIGEQAMFDLLRGAYHYRDLARKDYDALIELLSEGTSDRRGRKGARIHRDRITQTLRAKRGSRLVAITCGGAIPDNANYPVILQSQGNRVGEVDEDFAIDSNSGDIFLLGNNSWRILRVEKGRVFVEDAHGMPPTIPFWFGEAPARTKELSCEISHLRQKAQDIFERGDNAEKLTAYFLSIPGVGTEAAKQASDYLHASYVALGELPTQQNIIAERFFDEGGGMQLVVHAPFGGRINRAWGLALRKRFCKSFNFELQAAATDDGIIISLGEPHSFPLEDVAKFLSSTTVKEVLSQAILDSPFFEVRWRWNATRSLTVARRFGGKKVPPHLLRMRCDDLLSVVFPMALACQENVVGKIEIPDHPLVTTTVDDCLREAMDIEGLRSVITEIENSTIQFVGKDTTEPSPLCHEIISANPYAFLDDAPLEERRTRAITLRRGLAPEIARDLAELDPNAIAKVCASLDPNIRSADELHDHLQTVYVLPAKQEYSEWMDELTSAGQATRLTSGKSQLWVAAERIPMLRLIYKSWQENPVIGELPFEVTIPPEDKLRRQIVHAFLQYAGPQTSQEIATPLQWPHPAVEAALLGLESDGAILRGYFRNTNPSQIEWCHREILSSIHKKTIRTLRKKIEPTSPAAFQRFLFQWQRVAPRYQLAGAEGLLQVIEQLQGYQTAAAAWESQIFPSRLLSYKKESLDQLCFSGNILWCRLSPSLGGAPTKAAPIGFLCRASANTLRNISPDSAIDMASLPQHAIMLADFLRTKGASFVVDMVQELGLSANQVQDALWQLVTAGLATADGFGSLRILMRQRKQSRPISPYDTNHSEGIQDAKWLRAVSRTRRRYMRTPKHAALSLPTSSGRWSLLPTLQRNETEPADIQTIANQLLQRYGVVFRDLLVREDNLPSFRQLMQEYRKQEAQGKIRGGRFVSGFSGEQFALPEAVTMLRHCREPGSIPQTVTISACDPLNLVGILSPGNLFPATSGSTVHYRDGVAVAYTASGKTIALDDTCEASSEPPIATATQTSVFV